VNKLSVVIIDENPAVLQLVEGILRDYYADTLLVVGATSSHTQALHECARLQPQVVLLSVNQHHSATALRLIPRLHALLPDVCIIVVGAVNLSVFQEAALEAGADAFVPRVTLGYDLLPSLRRVPVAAEPQTFTSLDETGYQDDAANNAA
jgi:DNA-binding NarL/FixJ family response regulator